MLKNKLSEYVRLAAEGETVLVTDRSRVVAEIIPPQADRGPVADAILADAVREGLVTPARRRTDIPPRKPVMPFRQLMREIGQDRDER